GTEKETTCHCVRSPTHTPDLDPEPSSSINGGLHAVARNDTCHLKDSIDACNQQIAIAVDSASAPIRPANRARINERPFITRRCEHSGNAHAGQHFPTCSFLIGGETKHTVDAHLSAAAEVASCDREWLGW